MVADDLAQIRLLLQIALSGMGHEVIEAVDGDHALELLAQHRPDVAIFDVQMPGRNGLAVCRAVKSNPTLAGVGIIVLSAASNAADAIEAGADRFLDKPFRPHDLLAMIDELLEARQPSV